MVSDWVQDALCYIVVRAVLQAVADKSSLHDGQICTEMASHAACLLRAPLFDLSTEDVRSIWGSET